MYALQFAEGAIEDLRALTARDRAAVFGAIERRLTHQPMTLSRNCKELVGLVPPWDHVRPVWELRVGDWRVFYDPDPAEHTVVVRAVRRKGRRTTEEIL